MPPPVVTDPEESSDDGISEIPAEKGQETGDDGGEVDQDDGDLEMIDLGENEYEVELIRKHQWVEDPETGEPLLKYLVKWKGYEKKSDQTWEPEENLETAYAILKKYHKSIGGKPMYGDPESTQKSTKKAASSPRSSTPKTIHDKYSTSKSSSGRRRSGRPATNGGSSLKHQLSDKEDDEDDSENVSISATKPARSRRGKAVHKESEEPIPEATMRTKWEPPSGSWENKIMTVDTVEKDVSDGSLQVYLHWNDGRKSKHSAVACYRKAPQKMLQFYEMHLVFKEGTHRPSPRDGDMEGPPGVGGRKTESEEYEEGTGEVDGPVGPFHEELTKLAAGTAAGSEIMDAEMGGIGRAPAPGADG